MEFLSASTKSNFKALFYKDFVQWQNVFEDLIILTDPNSWIFITEPYEGNIVVSQLSTEERKSFYMEKKLFESIIACLPTDVASCYKNLVSSFDLWDTLVQDFKRNNKSNLRSPDERIKEKLMKKEEEIQALQSQILKMETEREEIRLTIVCLEKKVVEFENQQTVLSQLRVDHDLAIQTVQDLRDQIDKVSQSHTPQVEEKKNEKIYTDKSSEPLVRMVRAKKISWFTNYSLRKNKKYSEKSQSTKKCKLHMLDCCDSGYSQNTNRSGSFQKPKEAFKSTRRPESRKTKSCVYTRAQMFALAPRCHQKVQRRCKDFVPFSPREYRLPVVPRTEFRHETTRFNFRWNSISLDYLDASYKRLSSISRKIGTVLKWVPKVVV